MAPATIRRRSTLDACAENELVPTKRTKEYYTGDHDEYFSIPKYTVNLSLSPHIRYKHMALDFESQVSGLPALFDEVVEDYLPNVSVNKIRHVARFILRKVYSDEENEELRGISGAIGIDMWLLIAFNVLLDLFMGCTSGGVRIEHEGPRSRMLHFRTLDWDMNLLRKLIVQLDFVERAGGEFIASSLGYFGYVGILTGVRKGLSMSLNFRPYHNRNDRVGNFIYYFHIALVLLGFRPSISSLLRQCLLPSNTRNKTGPILPHDFEVIEQELSHKATTAGVLDFL